MLLPLLAFIPPSLSLVSLLPPTPPEAATAALTRLLTTSHLSSCWLTLFRQPSPLVSLWSVYVPISFLPEHAPRRASHLSGNCWLHVVFPDTTLSDDHSVQDRFLFVTNDTRDLLSEAHRRRRFKMAMIPLQGSSFLLVSHCLYCPQQIVSVGVASASEVRVSTRLFPDWGSDLQQRPLVAFCSSIPHFRRFQSTLAHRLNARLSCLDHRPAPGRLQTDGSWSGQMGSLKEGSLDMSSGLSMTWERWRAVHFTPPLSFSALSFSSRPSSGGGGARGGAWNEAFRPLLASGKSMAALVCLCACAVTLLLRRMEESDVTLGHVVSPLVQQPNAHAPTSCPARLLLGIWMLLCLILSEGFKSRLVSLGIAPNRQRTLDTFEDLVRSHFRWGSPNLDGVTGELLRACNTSVCTRLLSDMEAEREGDACVRRSVSEENFACVEMAANLRFLIAESGTDELRVAPARLFFLMDAIAVSRDAFFKDALDALVRRMTDAGLGPLQKDFPDSHAHSTRHGRNHGESHVTHEGDIPTPMSTQNLRGAILVLFCGCALAFLSLLAEVAMAAKRRRISRRQRRCLHYSLHYL